MFNLKNRKIYFFIALLLVINLLKNISIEDKIEQELIKNKLKEIGTISCHGVVDIECHLSNLLFEDNSTQTSYDLRIDKLKMVNLNLFKRQKIFDSQVKIMIKKLELSDARGVFKTIKKPIDVNISFSNENVQKINTFLVNDDLSIALTMDLEKESALSEFKFSSFSLQVERDNNVIKKMIYEFYKLKLLETKESDDEEFSATRGINLPLGKDSAEVIAQKVFLEEEVYDSVSILLLSELETLDVVMNNNEDNNITNFLEDIIKKNGETTLQIKDIKEEER